MLHSDMDMEKRLKRAVEVTTPDMFEAILQRHAQSEPAPLPPIIELPTKRARKPIIRQMAAIVVAMLVFMGGALFYQNNYAAYALLTIDVNPSIELTINQNQRVIDATPINEDGRQLLGNMQLSGAMADVAVNALIGAMVKQGYIDATRNSVLISIDDRNGKSGEALRDMVVSAANQTLAGGGAVISQIYKGDAELSNLAQTYHTSPGKAELIRQLISLNPALTFDMLDHLSIHELNLIASSKMDPPAGLIVSGTVSDPDHIGTERAIDIALEALDATRDHFDQITCEIDYEYSRMVYEVECYSANHEFEYTIDALTGKILEWESEWIHPEFYDLDAT